jgi:hypothetical protein
VLVVGHVAEARTSDGWFRVADLRAMFDALRVPEPAISRALTRLKNDQLVVKRAGTATWALTPEGREVVRELVGAIDPEAIEAEVAVVGSAELSHAQHLLIPPELAPRHWAPAIRALLNRFPFETNVFLMTRFPKDETETEFPDPVQGVIRVSREALRHHGMHLHLASDRNADDDLFGNIAGHMWACKYGIGLFETRFGDEYNDNLQIEVGGMLITGRRCALLRDRDTPKLPTDFVGQIYKSVDFDDLDAVAMAVHLWAAEDLGLGRCECCPPDPHEQN